MTRLGNYLRDEQFKNDLVASVAFEFKVNWQNFVVKHSILIRPAQYVVYENANIKNS